MWPFLALLALCLTTRTIHVSAAVPGTFEDGGNTLVSAMMVSKAAMVLSLSVLTSSLLAILRQYTEGVHFG